MSPASRHPPLLAVLVDALQGMGGDASKERAVAFARHDIDDGLLDRVNLLYPGVRMPLPALASLPVVSLQTETLPHCQVRSDEAIQHLPWAFLDCFAALAMTPGEAAAMTAVRAAAMTVVGSGNDGGGQR